jgi:hypothetical protein
MCIVDYLILTNIIPDDSMRKETENMIDSGSQDVQVESDSEPDNDDTPDPVPSDRDANENDVRKYHPVGKNGIKIHLKCENKVFWPSKTGRRCFFLGGIFL